MAVAIDASTPARWAGTGVPLIDIASASFTPPANSLLVLTTQCDGSSDADFGTYSIATAGLTWTKQVERTWSETTGGGQSSIWTCPQVSSAARICTFSHATGNDRRISCKLYVLTGVDISGTPVDTVGASNEGGTNTDPTNTSSVTPGASGLLIVSACDWAQTGTGTSSNLTLDMADYAGAITAWTGYRTCSNGVGLTGNLNPPGTPQFKWCQIVVREAAVAGLALGSQGLQVRQAIKRAVSY